MCVCHTFLRPYQKETKIESLEKEIAEIKANRDQLKLEKDNLEKQVAELNEKLETQVAELNENKKAETEIPKEPTAAAEPAPEPEVPGL